MRSPAQWCGCSSRAGISLNGFPPRRRRSVSGSISWACIDAWPAAVVIGVLALAVRWLSGRGTWSLALPFAALWIASPAVARWISRSPLVAADAVSRLPMSGAAADRAADVAILRDLRDPADNMLPPDNFQEDPTPVLAHRTSPTNVGLYSSRWSPPAISDGSGRRSHRTTRDDAGTMAGLHRFRGHFYNWYDTRDLRPWIRDMSPPSTAATWRASDRAGKRVPGMDERGYPRRPAPAPGSRTHSILPARQEPTA